MGIGEDLKDALQVNDFPSSRLLERAMARLDQPPVARRWKAVAGIAAVLVLGVAVGFIRFAHLRSVQPVSHRPPVSVSSAQEGLLSYRLVSPQVGWVTIFRPDGRTVIARTSDAGNHWMGKLEIDGLPGPTPAKFLTASVALIIGQQQGVPRQSPQEPAFPITVWMTTDGGAHWQVRPAPPAAGYLISADFIDASHGWLLTRPPDSNSSTQGSRVLVFETQDGAEHWTMVGGSGNGSALGGSDTKVGLKFISQTTGWISSFDPSGGGTLYVTRDAGRTWQLQSLPSTGDAASASRISIELPTFFSQQEGVIVIDVAQAALGACASPGSAGAASPTASCQIPRMSFVSSTHDGGRTWSVPRRIAVVGTLALIDSHRWAVAGADGISTSEDAGASWSVPRPLPIPSGWAPIGVELLDLNQGWVSIWDQPSGPLSLPLLSAGRSSNTGPINAQIQGIAPRFELIATVDGGGHWSQVALGGLD